jgi:membrane protein YdbS with pleckstrin-like domain
MPDIFNSEKNSKKISKIKRTKEENEEKEVERRTGYNHKHKFLTKEKNKDSHPLSSFRFYPDRAEFINKDPEEKVILLLRRHPITNICWITLSFFGLILPAFISIMPVFLAMPSGFQFIFIIAWYLLVTAYVFEKFLGWFYHVNIVTDERIFDIDFIHMVHREMTDANIDQIQDVTVEIGSPIRTVFNYGNVIIQTAAQIPQIMFESVPQPDKVARILRELRIEEEVEKLEGRIR